MKPGPPEPIVAHRPGVHPRRANDILAHPCVSGPRTPRHRPTRWVRPMCRVLRRAVGFQRAGMPGSSCAHISVVGTYFAARRWTCSCVPGACRSRGTMSARRNHVATHVTFSLTVDEVAHRCENTRHYNMPRWGLQRPGLHLSLVRRGRSTVCGGAMSSILAPTKLEISSHTTLSPC